MLSSDCSPPLVSMDVDLFLTTAMAGSLTALVIMHRRRQDAKRIMLEEYQKEQMA